MTYLLDSNVCINYLRRRQSVIKQRINALPTNTIVLCAPVLTELVRGIRRSHNPTQEQARVTTLVRQFQVLPFDVVAAEEAGRVQSTLDAIGLPIGIADAYIAAIAIVNNLTLVTHNVREFGRVTGLVYEDWQAIP
ncbi:MAG: PIN domain-containing protein [Chloroflexaceae bacterium]